MTATAAVLAAEVLTPEDLARSADRERVHDARTGRRRWRLAWLLTGPGVLAMLGENDGPSMISYAADGARFGLKFFLPFIIVLFAMSFVCQEMCMRLGAVTHRGYGQLVLNRFGPVWGWFAAGDLAITNVITLVSEFVAIRVGLGFFGLNAWVAAGLGISMVVVSAGGGSYRRWERVVLGLALFNGLFVVAALLADHGGGGVVGTAHTQAADMHTVLLLVASTIGATVTPWMVFFQQSASVDKGMTSADIKHGRIDTGVGALLATVCGIGALVAGAAVAGHGDIDGLAGAGFPGALAASSGNAAGTVFALGMIEAGALAILTISASTAYAAGECVGVSHSFNASPQRALLFHGTNLASALLAAVIILIPGAPLLSISLNANVLATALAPVSLIFLLMLASDRRLMGDWANRRSTNVLGGLVIALVAIGGAAYGIDSFFRAI